MRDQTGRIWISLYNPKIFVVAFFMMTCLIHLQIYYKNNSNEIVMEKNQTKVVINVLSNAKILCMITTMPENHDAKAIHVKNTWGKRCDKLLFMSSEDNSSLPSIDLHIDEGRQNLWVKTRRSFKYVYDHHLKDYGWFLKADDDTYVIMENLRHLLSNYNPYEVPIYFGRRIRGESINGFMSGGAGYVLSQNAVQLFIEKALPNNILCPDEGRYEDVALGKCLSRIGVITGESRDSLNRGKFFPLKPLQHLHPGKSEEDRWFRNYAIYRSDRGLNCCSDLAISFHYIEPYQMYELEYFIYHLHPFGIQYSDSGGNRPT